ncbi:hypothetical protein HPB47_021613 [Ixodes persulcatus]|uniref:Uncharacterized protein n=1 Tax=Ixodes persulcatus TaxID=34615 RepID=A0AC60QEM1_IXOPE|nr:hypothetical protein HPB47_021613 [Ixodes persulcatus]
MYSGCCLAINALKQTALAYVTNGDEDEIVKPDQPDAMTSPLGKLAEFCPDTGNIDIYPEKFELFSSANEIDASKKLPVFMTVLGEKDYVTLRSLLLPKTPTEVKYVDAGKVLQQHYAPKRSVVTERYHFYRRHQEPSESFALFIVAMKRLASTCSFGSFLEDALRVRLIA